MRRLHVFSKVCIALAAMLASASSEAALITVGSNVFGDDFTGSPNSTTLDASKWTSAVAGAGASVLLNTNYAPSNVEIYTGSGTSRQAHISSASALDFSASPNDWWAQVVFKFVVHGGSWAAPNSPLNTARQYNILSGQHAISASAQGNSQGIDLRAVRYGAGLWGLAWYGIDDAGFHIADILDDNAGAGFAFSDTQKYAVTMHRKNDNTVDIYLDKTAGDGSASDLIANKPLILGLNPVGLTSGDWSSSVAGYMLLDKVNIGEGTVVPEPHGMLLTVMIVAGLAPVATRRKR